MYLQGRDPRTVDNIQHGKASSRCSLLKVALSSTNGLSTFGSNTHVQATVEKIRSKFHNSSLDDDVNGGPDALTERNQGPRTNKPKTHYC